MYSSTCQIKMMIFPYVREDIRIELEEEEKEEDAVLSLTLSLDLSVEFYQ